MRTLNNLKILITGACGVVSRSVIRSLKKSSYFVNATYIGTDTCENIYGLHEGLFNRIYKVPGLNSNNYKEIMTNIIVDEKIDVALIIPELEVLEWAINKYPTSYLIPSLNFCKSVINKASLYKILENSSFVPKFEILSRQEILAGHITKFNSYPIWIRDYSPGSDSGKGALKINNVEEAKCWSLLNSNINDFLLTEFLPGGNYACLLLYENGKILKIASYERLDYFMATVAPSGITGNICKGRLINDEKIVEVASKAINIICTKWNEKMNGLVAVDLKADSDGNPYITEINIRHVAATSAFASANFNLAEYQLLLTLGKTELIDSTLEKLYPKDNLILRDIDGTPLWLEHYKEIDIGEYK